MRIKVNYQPSYQKIAVYNKYFLNPRTFFEGAQKLRDGYSPERKLRLAMYERQATVDYGKLYK